MSYFHLLKVVGRGSKTQLQVSEYLNVKPHQTTTNEMNRALGHLCAHIG